jgi:hypothetical protein
MFGDNIYSFIFLDPKYIGVTILNKMYRFWKLLQSFNLDIQDHICLSARHGKTCVVNMFFKIVVNFVISNIWNV